MRIRVGVSSLVNGVLLFLFMTTQNLVAQDSFRGIIPLVTTKAEVEEILGKPNEFGRYELEEGRVYVHYNEVECAKKIYCNCIAPRGTVKFIRVSLNRCLKLSELQLDPKAFQRKVFSTDPLGETYFNKKTGVVYEALDGEITHIGYGRSHEVCRSIEKIFREESRIIKTKIADPATDF